MRAEGDHLPLLLWSKDFSQNLHSGAPLDKGKRRSKIQHGESMKRGCLCHFMVRTTATSDGIAELRMYCSDHHNAAGEACHGLQCSQCGRQHTAPYLSADCKAFVREAVLNEVPAHSIVSQMRERLHREHMIAQNLPTIESAQLAIQVH